MDATDRVGMHAEVRLDGQMSARAIDDGGCAAIERRPPRHARREIAASVQVLVSEIRDG
jgi:hypothetical protein